MELEELNELKAEGEQLIESIINSKDDESQIISKAIRLLFLQERFLGTSINHIHKSMITFKESHMDLIDLVARLQESNADFQKRIEKLEGERNHD